MLKVNTTPSPERKRELDELSQFFRTPAAVEVAPAPTCVPVEIPEEGMPGQITSAANAQRFILGGNATLTMRSLKTGTRFTYRVHASEDKAVYFVSVLVGQDNEGSYKYLGTIRNHQAGPRYNHGRKSKIGEDAPSAIAFSWAYAMLAKGKLPSTLQIWHEGRCGRCGRKLTVPESIASGFGPECINHVGG